MTVVFARPSDHRARTMRTAAQKPWLFFLAASQIEAARAQASEDAASARDADRRRATPKAVEATPTRPTQDVLLFMVMRF